MFALSSQSRMVLMVALAAGGLIAGRAIAADDKAQSDRSNPPSNQGVTAADRNAAADASDRGFIMKAAEGGLAEVKLGELAQQKATAQDVKDFGKRMVDDHSKANTELQQLAQNKNIEVPTELKGEQKEHYDKLAKMSGKDFDRAYIKHMVKDHDEDIAEFKKEARDGKDPDVRNWASKTLPTLEEHAKLIDRVAQANGVESARTASEKQPPEKPTDQNNGNQGADKQTPKRPQK
jgi:putative membrane protein